MVSTNGHTMKLLTANDLAKIHNCQPQTIRKRAKLRDIRPVQQVGRFAVWMDLQSDQFLPGPNGWCMKRGRKARPRKAKR